MDLYKLIESFEEKTGEKVISFTIQKDNVLRNYLIAKSKTKKKP